MTDDTPITFQEYRNEIESLADSIEEKQEQYDEELGRLVRETVDGHQWVIYNKYHAEVLRHSDPEEWKHLIGDTNSHREVLQAMTFDAIRTDVWEELEKKRFE